jgi:hypothetical protein
VLGVDHVPAAASPPTGPGTATPRPPSRPSQTRTRRHRREPGVVVGHHQTRRPAQMDLVPSLRHLGRLLPVRCRLARRPTRIGAPRRTTHRCLHRQRTRRRRPIDLARRPRFFDDLANRRPTPRRSRGHPLPLPPPRLQRQPVLRITIQNPQEHTPVPATLRQPGPRPRFTDTFFAHYNHQHRHSGIGYHTPIDVHTGRHHQIRANRQAVLDHAYTTQPHRFRKPPIAPLVPEVTWINPPPETAPNLSQTA